jgi:peptide/nickel transport system permease protein
MALIVVILLMTFLGALVNIIPGDPVNTILGARATDTNLPEIVREEMGLDDPVYQQVFDFITGAFQGDLGRDFVTQLPVTTLIAEQLPHTLVLMFSSLFLAVLIGIPLGVFSATHPNTWIDRIVATISISLITIPAYVAGLFLLVIFTVQLDALPAIGAGDFSDPVGYLERLVLPSIAIALTWIGYLSRLVRASMLEVLGANYIRTAHAFGIGERVIFYRYALKNAIIPTIAVLGLAPASLVSQAVFVEYIFARPGLGSLTVDAITTRNYPIVRGTVLVVALIFVIGNLLADLSYRYLDPRIRPEERLGT